MNIQNLVKDWGGFEQLIAKLHETGEVIVEHNVVLPGRSGATRQIDVLIRHKQGLYEHLIVAECKYWNSRVERLHVDALITTVREVGASRGVIFSTNGFQAGAIEQAKHDGVELFTIRELTPQEWGMPGQFFDLFLQVNGISIGNVKIAEIALLKPETASGISIHLGDPNPDSGTPITWEGKPDKTLEKMIERIARESAKKSHVSKPIKFDGNGYEGEVRYLIKVNIAPKNPIHAKFTERDVYLAHISFDLGVTVMQSRLTFDRAENFAFAVAVEDCVRRTVTTASRRVDESVTVLNPLPVESSAIASEDIYQNGSLATIWVNGFQPFDGFDGLEPGKPIVRAK